MPVARFNGKPTIAIAEELLKQGALWNGDVFTFHLGYMMSIARKYITLASFNVTRARYSESPKMAFDYEVAEKASLRQ